MSDRSYSIVTPAYNEEAHIEKTIQSVCKQTIHPVEWVIVSDASTDRTDEIVKNASKEYPWIRLLRIEDNSAKNFARVVYNTEAGISSLSNQRCNYLGLLDADVSFQEDYFERLIEKFENNKKLGLAGGVVIDIGLPKDRFPINRSDVPGAVQFFRRECYESLGGLIPIPEGGWDGMTCAKARMNGYKTQLCTDLVVDHHKPRNVSQGGVLKRKYQMGIRDYAAGYHPLFELFKCISRIPRERPYFIASVVWGCGYTVSLLKGKSRMVPKELLQYIREEQLKRLFQKSTVS